MADMFAWVLDTPITVAAFVGQSGHSVVRRSDAPWHIKATLFGWLNRVAQGASGGDDECPRAAYFGYTVYRVSVNAAVRAATARDAGSADNRPGGAA